MANSAQHRRLRSRMSSPALALIVLFGLGLVATESARAQTFTVLYGFTGQSDGGHPYAGLIRDAAGSLYSTTETGGDLSACGGSGCGTVFKVDASGNETVLYGFMGWSYGETPYAGVIRDKAGNLYGTTYWGGSGYYPYGEVFKVDTSGTKTVLYSFCSAQNCVDGAYPYGGLIRDKAGNLYGTTLNGGSSSEGVVFKVGKTDTETVLHTFEGSDGAYPLDTSLIIDKKGNLYGVTQAGGTSNYGVVYKLSKGGIFTVLYRFSGGTDGCYPYGVVLRDKAGNLYGTTYGCGASGYGTVYKLDSTGVETVLHSFTGSDGAHPYAGVIMDAKGNLYGDTYEGGTSGIGTVYELDQKGVLTLLHSFAGSDGGYPYGGLVRDKGGNLYGTTYGGTSNDYFGSVWKLTP
jgi:uncharacterized repeat protein (TIGR03803 family)